MPMDGENVNIEAEMTFSVLMKSHFLFKEKSSHQHSFSHNV